ncbi:hypothetical protein HDU93_009372, partial [Gonapodya sp. JEL0774]
MATQEPASPITPGDSIPMKLVEGSTPDEKEPLTDETSREPAGPSFWDKFKRKPPADAKPKEPTISFFALFRFATKMDMFMVFVGIISAAANGAMQPVMTIPMSNVVQAFITYNPNYADLVPPGQIGSRKYFDDTVHEALLIFLGVGVACFFSGYLQYTMLLLSAEHQLKTMRDTYFRAILRQDIGWFESGNHTGDLTNRLQSDTSLIKDGMAEKLGVVVQCSAQFVAGVLIAYTRGWKMSLVITCLLPLMLMVGTFMGINLSKRTKSQQDAYAAAGAVAEQSISNIRTVAAFGGEHRNIQRYEQKVKVAYDWGLQIGIVTGLGLGTMFFVMFSTYGFGFWYGSTLIESGDYTGGQ